MFGCLLINVTKKGGIYNWIELLLWVSHLARLTAAVAPEGASSSINKVSTAMRLPPRAQRSALRTNGIQNGTNAYINSARNVTNLCHLPTAPGEGERFHPPVPALPVPTNADDTKNQAIRRFPSSSIHVHRYVVDTYILVATFRGGPWPWGMLMGADICRSPRTGTGHSCTLAMGEERGGRRRRGTHAFLHL